MKRPMFWLVIAGALHAIGCSPSDSKKASETSSVPVPSHTSTVSPPAPPIELFSWWARVGESDALGALMRIHNKHYPLDTMINASAELSGLARKTLVERMRKGEPPDSFQANIGYDLDQWVIVNGLDDRESRLLPLDEELPKDVADWRAHMPKVLVELLSHDGKMYAVPSNVHRINSIFYNKHLFDKYGLELPKSVADLELLGERLAASHVPLFAFGTREPWTLALFVFECLLVAEQGAQFYQDYLHRAHKADDPRIVGVLNRALRLIKFANADHQTLSWLQALDLVERGNAAMTVMGDWAHVSFKARGLKLGVDYGELPFPGTATTMVFTSDTFSLPRNSKNKEGAKRLLATMGSREAQASMSAAKVSLSARTDVEPPNELGFDSKYTSLIQGNLLLALSGSVPPRFAEDVAQALSEAVSEGDIEPVLHALRSRYALLR